MKSIQNQNQKRSFKNNRGFTLIEIVIASILLGIFGALFSGYIRDAATTGSANVLAKNATEINTCITDLRGTGATFATGTYGVTAGTATTPASLTFPATAVAADVAAFLTALNSPGIVSFGHTASLSKLPTTLSSYTYTIVNGVPVFAGVPGAQP
jgi:prepilin-type N-terminal cleavage/methylation domain-containing protein